MTRIHRNDLKTVSVTELREALALVPNASAVLVAGQRVPVVKVRYPRNPNPHVYQYRMRCPRCARTCDKLVLPALQCLRCTPHVRITYRGMAAERQAVADKVRQKLGWPEHTLDGPRPKFMHRSTFERLKTRYYATLKRAAQNDRQKHRIETRQREHEASFQAILDRCGYTPGPDSRGAPRPRPGPA